MLWKNGRWWEGLDGGCSYRWTDLSPLLSSRGPGRLHFWFSALQLNFLIELGQGFLLAFSCAWAVWILLQPFSSSTLGFLLFYQTTLKAFQRVILTNSLPPASALHWSFPRGNQPRPYDSRSQEPHAPQSAILWPLAQDLQRHCLPWDFCEPGIILSLLWRDHYSLSREVMSDWCSEVAN